MSNIQDQINTIREALALMPATHTTDKALTALDQIEAAVGSQEPVARVDRVETPFGDKLRPVLEKAVPVGTKLYAAPVAQQPQAETYNHEAQGQIEFLDKKNNALSAAIRKVMARLADLLDEDQFKDIDGLVLAAGVQPQAEAVPTVQIVNCDTCKHSANSCDDYPCNRCGVEFGDGPFNRWEKPQQAEPVPQDVGQLEYRGNSVAYIHQKMTAYRSAIDAAWQAMRDAGHPPDGRTPLAQAITKALAPQQAEAVTSDVVRDAARYRQVRRGQKWSVIDGIGDDLRGDALDAAIDAAIAAQGAKT